MKILHVSHQYFPSVGGNQLHIQLMSEQLAALKEDVYVFTSWTLHEAQYHQPDPTLDNLPLEEDINGVHVRRFPVNYRFMSFVLQKKIKVRGAYKLFQVLTQDTFGYWMHGPVIWGMFNAIRRLKPDIILATNNYFFTTYLCYLAKKVFKFPLVYMPVTHIAHPWTKHPFNKVIADAADLVITCTEYEKKYLIGQGYNGNKIKVLSVGIRPDIFQGADGNLVQEKYAFQKGLVVAYFGRKVPDKGIETLIDSMRLVWQQCPEAQLLLAGAPVDYFSPTIRKHLDQYSPEEQKRIINIDNFTDDEKKHFYDAIAILAVPSNTDCFGMVYLEAWVSAKPVIACKNTPQETIIRDGVDGLLTEYGNKESLAQAIIRLLKDEGLRRTMGEQGRKAIEEKYNLETYGRHLQKEYHLIRRSR